MSPTPTEPVRLAVLTSGGDAQGMNAAVRAVVRTAIGLGAQPYGVYEGLAGLVGGGELIRPMSWFDVSNVLQRGGTSIGTARSKQFRERDGMKQAVSNLIGHGIDRLVVIGGDGSLTGTTELSEAWPDLTAELVSDGVITAQQAAAHPHLLLIGLVGSIDNDLVGLDMTIGADSALHRITEAIDALTSTAASHQRTFVVEVMGRRCGYLPLLSAVADNCDAAFIPEDPPTAGWEDRLCADLRAGRTAGRRDSIVLVAEGAVDEVGEPLGAERLKTVIEDRLHEDTRVTILGHVQRGGTPSAYDRWMSTMLGNAAAHLAVSSAPDAHPVVIGPRGGRVETVDLRRAVADTRALGQRLAAGDAQGAVQARGETFTELHALSWMLSRPPEPLAANAKRIGIIHAGGLAPGMNAITTALVRFGENAGYRMLGITGGFPGLVAGRIDELTWQDVDGWMCEAGAHLLTSRHVPTDDELYTVSRALEEAKLDGLVVVGGFNAFDVGRIFRTNHSKYPGLRLPLVVIPATIDNNVPGSSLCVGADSALNVIVESLDRLRASASANRRCFVVDVMGRTCGYLTLTAGLATGAEQVYLNETGISLPDVTGDAERMRKVFATGHRFFLVLRNEEANQRFTPELLGAAFAEAGDGLFDVRSLTLGHVQQGGTPSPFDRILAVRLVRRALDQLLGDVEMGSSAVHVIGATGGALVSTPISHLLDAVDETARRPLEQPWLARGLRVLREVNQMPAAVLDER